MLCVPSARHLFGTASLASSALSASAELLVQDLDSANNYFASVCRDPNYCLANVTCFIDTIDSKDYEIYLHSYEVERLLYRMKSTSPGLDNIPRWFFHYCSVFL